MKLIQKYFMFFASLTIVAALCFGSQTNALAQSQAQGTTDTISPPLLPDLTWENLGSVQKDLNINGQTLTLSGDMFQAVETFQNEIPESVFEYYSSSNLLSLGWNFVGNVSFESIYWHSSGIYLVVQVMECENSETDYCVNIWQSVNTDTVPSAEQSSAAALPALVAFYKSTPANGATISYPTTTYKLLQWSDAEIGSTDRYQYCIDETNNATCDSDDWKTRNSLYSGGPGDFTVLGGHTYYWQVRVRDANKYANGGTWWSFYVQPGTAGPNVTSIVRGNPTSSITNATNVNFIVTFNESVTGVSADASDFALATSGIAGASISAVTGSGATYTVTVNTGTGNGTIHLDLIDDDSIQNSQNIPLGGAGAGNGNYTTGQTYTIDKAVPQVISSVRDNSNPTNLSSVSFTVTFSENVTGVDAADFSLNYPGLTGAAIAAVSGSGATRTVTVNTGTGSGMLRVNVIDNDTILDAAGNKLGGTGTGNGNYTAGQLYTIDKAAPTVDSSTRDNLTPTNLSSVSFTVLFSENVVGVDAADFSLTTTGITGAAITSVGGSDSYRIVTVNTGTGNGTLRLNVIDNDTILDEAGNKLGGTGTGNGNYTTGQTYTIEKNVPTVISSTLVNLSLTNLPTVSFTVTFSEVVTGVDAADFSLTAPGLTGAAITGVSGSGTTRTVTVGTGTGSGTLRLNVIDNDTIQDAAGNKLGGTGIGNGNYTAGQAYTIDRSAPTVASSVRVNSNPTNLSSISFTVTFSEAVTGVDTTDFNLTTIGVTGASITSVSGLGTIRTVTVSTGTGNGTLRLNVVDDDTISDILGYRLGGTGAGNGNYTAGQSYTIDRSAPTVVSSVRANPSITNLANVKFTVTFSKVVTGVDVADFSLTYTGVTGVAITAVSGSGATRTVTVSTGAGNGTLRLNVVDNDTILSLAGTKLGGTGLGNGNYNAGQTYTIDKTAPTVVSSVRVNPSLTNLAQVNFLVTFSEAVTGIDTADFSLTRIGITGTTAITAISGSGATRTVRVSTGIGNGTLLLNVMDNDTIRDAAGNPLGGTGAGNGNYTTGQAYTIDKTVPTVVSSMRVNPNPTNLSSVSFTVTFSETVTGVNAADFSLISIGVTGASITGVSGSGITRTVTVNTGTGNGTLRLKVVDDDTIRDAAGNKLGGTGVGNGNYAGQAYTISKP